MKHKFTVEYSEHFGYSIIAILKDGKPFWEEIPEAKKNFRFGVKKAKMVVECIKIIRDFYSSGGKKPARDTYKNYSICYKEGFSINMRWKPYPYITLYRTNEIKDNDIIVIQKDSRSLCFGRAKAKSLDILFKEIKDFAKRRSV